jgi:hypothetical protein
MAGADGGSGGAIHAPAAAAADGGCLGCMGDAGKITGTIGGGITVGGSMLGACWICWRSPWFKRTTVRIANDEASTGAMQRWRHEVEVNPVAMVPARAAERTYISARQLDKAARLRLQLSIVSGLRQVSPMPRSESAPPAEGGRATEGDPATTPPTAESTPAPWPEGARIATTESAPPATTGTAPAARHAMPRLRAKYRLTACCGGLAACCGCKALPTDHPSPRHFPGPLPPEPATGTSSRDSGGPPPPGPARGGALPLPITGPLPSTPATGPSPPVRGTRDLAGASSALSELTSPVSTAARTEGRQAAGSKRGPLSDFEIEGALRRASATRAASRTRFSAAGSSGSQQVRLEISAPSQPKTRASAPQKTRGPPTPRSLLSVEGRSKTLSAGGDQSPVTPTTGRGPAP